jgi:shikimate kinase
MITIILIGPVGVGKTTTAQLLAERLSLPYLALDELRWSYFQEIGYDHERQQQLGATGGIAAVLAYWEPFEVHALERVLTDHQAGVLDVGGGYTIANDPTLVSRIRSTLAPYPYVFLLLPTPQLDESIQVLDDRIAGQLPDEFPLPTHVERHFKTQQLAKHVVYTHNKTTEAIRDEILAIVQAGPSTVATEGTEGRE